MIRQATQNDFEKVLALWNTAFGNEKEFTKWYFSQVYNFEYTIVFEEDGKIISMLQRLPFKTNNFDKVTYIYGACTHPTHRGLGLMEQLLKYSKNLDIEEGINVSILIPQGENLFEYYSRFGYEVAFSLTHNIYKKEQIDDNSYQIRLSQLQDINSLQSIYTKNLQDTEYILRDENYWGLLLNLFKSLGGECFIVSKESKDCGYAFVWNDENKTYIQELVADDSKVKIAIINKIMQWYSINEIEALELGVDNTNQKLGSAVFYSDNINRELKANLLFN